MNPRRRGRPAPGLLLLLVVSGCGAPVEFRSAQSTHAVCSFCQSTVVRDGDTLARIGKMAETDAETLKAKRQAVYWQALVAERAKNRGLAQKLILDSLEQDPLTKEARWVNPQGDGAPKARMPASVSGETEVKESEEKETEESHEGPSPAHH